VQQLSIQLADTRRRIRRTMLSQTKPLQFSQFSSSSHTSVTDQNKEKDKMQSEVQGVIKMGTEIVDD
jgi:hypothetical protein